MKLEPQLYPWWQQYLEVKEQYKDALVFFRLGDYFEAFGEDTEVLSDTFGLVITSRQIGEEEKALMVGFPYFSAETYFSELISKGHKIAICEKVGMKVDGVIPVQVEYLE